MGGKSFDLEGKDFLCNRALSLGEGDEHWEYILSRFLAAVYSVG